MSKRGGRREGSGRKKGVPNKITTELKDAILAALDTAGGKEYLVNCARENPVAFLSLLGRILPLQVAGDPKKPLTTVSKVEVVIIDPKAQ